ncbi:MAG: hypothetical protein AB7F50_00700 [Fimbriimonadaceae bacterium]
MLRDGQGVEAWILRGTASNLFNMQEAEPFRPAYRTAQDALDFARLIADRIGRVNYETSSTSPPEIPEPDANGLVTSRMASVMLVEQPPLYPVLMGGNRVEITFDTRDYALGTVAVVRGFRYEEPAGRPISEEEADTALRSVIDIGRLQRVTGPGYSEVLDSGTVTSSGSSYARQRLVPLVFTVKGSRKTGVVHAVTGTVLRYRDSASEGSQGASEQEASQPRPAEPGSQRTKSSPSRSRMAPQPSNWTGVAAGFTVIAGIAYFWRGCVKRKP